MNWISEHKKLLAGLGFLALLGVSLWTRMVDFQTLYPYFYYQDETRHAQLSLGLIRQETLRTDFYLYPDLTIYLTSAAYAGYFLGKDFKEIAEAKSLRPIVESAKKFDETSWTSLKIERGLALVLGMISVMVFFWLARSLLGDFFGLISAFLFSLFPLSVSFSHLAKADIFAMAFMLLSWRFQIKLIQEGKLRDYLLAGIFAALTFDCKVNSLPVLSYLVAILIRANREQSSGRAALLDQRILLGALATGLAAVLASPFYFLNLDQAIKAVGWIYFATEWIPYFHFDPHQFWTDKYYYSLTVLIPSMVSLPVWLLALAGIFQKIIKFDYREGFFLVFCFVCFTYGFDSISGSYYYYLYFSILPLIALFSISVLRTIFEKSSRAGKGLVLTLLALLMITSLHRFRFYHQLNFQAYEAAGRYLSGEVKPGSRVLSFSAHLPGPSLSRLELKPAWPQDLSQEMIAKANPDYILIDRWNFAGFEKFYRDQLPIASYLDQLLAGQWGYRPVKSFLVKYPGDSFYQWLDPEFLVELDLLEREKK